MACTFLWLSPRIIIPLGQIFSPGEYTSFRTMILCAFSFLHLKPIIERKLKQIQDRAVRHSRTCKNLQEYECDYCPKKFNHRKGLTRHQKVHTDAVHYIDRLRNLAESRRIHERKFPCDECDRAYTTNQRLKYHKLSAHGNGPQFQCPFCPKKLMTPCNLNVSYLSAYVVITFFRVI